MPFSIPEHIACLHTAMLYSIMDLLLRTPYSIKWWGKTGNKIWQNLGRIWIKKGWQTCKTSSKSNSFSSDDSQEDRRGSDWLSWPQSEPEASKGAGANGGKAMWGDELSPNWLFLHLLLSPWRFLALFGVRRVSQSLADSPESPWSWKGPWNRQQMAE